MQSAFRGRKRLTQNVLAAVSFDLRFTYVLAGWEGSAHDALERIKMPKRGVNWASLKI